MCSPLAAHLKFTFYMQGELEHRTSKAQFTRTSWKGYVAQMASIERQQAHIHRIHRQCDVLHIADPVPNEPYKHHVISQSQNFPQELTRFVQTNLADPTTKVCLLQSLHLDYWIHG